MLVLNAPEVRQVYEQPFTTEQEKHQEREKSWVLHGWSTERRAGVAIGGSGLRSRS